MEVIDIKPKKPAKLLVKKTAIQKPKKLKKRVKSAHKAPSKPSKKPHDFDHHEPFASNPKYRKPENKNDNPSKKVDQADYIKNLFNFNFLEGSATAELMKEWEKSFNASEKATSSSTNDQNTKEDNKDSAGSVMRKYASVFGNLFEYNLSAFKAMTECKNPSDAIDIQKNVINKTISDCLELYIESGEEIQAMIDKNISDFSKMAERNISKG